MQQVNIVAFFNLFLCCFLCDRACALSWKCFFVFFSHDAFYPILHFQLFDVLGTRMATIGLLEE